MERIKFVGGGVVGGLGDSRPVKGSGLFEVSEIVVGMSKIDQIPGIAGFPICGE